MFRRETGDPVFFTLWVFVIGVFFCGRAVAQSEAATSTLANNSSSNWNLTVEAPPVIEAGTNLDIFVKCKLTNLSHERVDTLQHARLYLIDSGSQTQKLLYYDRGIREGPRIDPGESTTWWQHGRATAEGSFKLFARWDGNDKVQSPRTRVTIRRSTAQPDDGRPDRARVIRQFGDRFPEVMVNTSTISASYTCLTFTNDPVVVDGEIYQAIRFQVPPEGGNLEWSFVIPKYGPNTTIWFIVGAEDDIHGFDTFSKQRAFEEIPDIAETTDMIICQTLDADQLTPGHWYYLWFQCLWRDIPGVTVSLNIFPNRTYPCNQIFRGVYERDW